MPTIKICPCGGRWNSSGQLHQMLRNVIAKNCKIMQTLRQNILVLVSWSRSHLKRPTCSKKTQKVNLAKKNLMTLNQFCQSVAGTLICQATLASHQSVPYNDHGNTLKLPASASWYWQPDSYNLMSIYMNRKWLNYSVPVLVMLGLLTNFVWFVSAAPVVQLSL